MATKTIDFNKLTVFEALDLINKDTGMLYTYFRFAEGSPLHRVFVNAFIPERKFLLPEGDPPFTPSKTPAGASSCDLLVAIRKGRFNYFDGTVQLHEVKREQLFINLLETVHQSEAKVLLAIKDQQLTKLFPNITWQVLEAAGYLPHREVEQKETEQQRAQDSKSKPARKPRTTKSTERKSTRTTRKTVKEETAQTEAAE